MQTVLEHLGVAVAAITGVLAARGKRVDLFGVLVLAIVTAFGGGTIRDLALGVRPVFWVSDSTFIITATAAALVTFVIARAREVGGTVLLVADACALAFFTMVGAKKALTHDASPYIAVTMGVITGVAGGMIRDVLIDRIPLVFGKEIYLYATAALAGAVIFVLLENFFPGAWWNMPIGTIVALVLRLAGIRWKLTLPLFDDPRQE
jgi:uncharacterized membrane protein YeiH